MLNNNILVEISYKNYIWLRKSLQRSLNRILLSTYFLEIEQNNSKDNSKTPGHYASSFLSIIIK